jgi:hypothetical protein
VLGRAADHATGPTQGHLYWFYASALLFMGLPLALRRAIPGLRGADLGTGLGDWRLGLKISGFLYAVFLPFVVGAALTGTFSQHYPLSGGANANGAALLVYEIGYLTYFVGWEFVHRGLLCVGLYPRFGAIVILLHMIPFAVMHGGKPEPEAYGSIIAGLALGAVAVRTRSFWWGALLHFAVALTMDVLALALTGRFPKAW